jgi:hypothetical protein
MSKAAAASSSLSEADAGSTAGATAAATSPVRNNHMAYQHGHSFVKKTFHKPTNCHYCSELLWGLMGQGFICEGKAPPRLPVMRPSRP